MSDPSDDANRWSWVTPDGKTVTGAKGELMLALRGGRLPPATLVWRNGWAEWLPATRVTELKAVLPPGVAEPAQAPKVVGSQPPPAPVRNRPQTSRPPPAPVRNRPQTSRPPPAPVRVKSERQLLEIPGPRVPTASGPVAAVPGVPTRQRGVSILGPPREQMTNSPASRAPLPTLGGEELVDPRMTTLRPPGAVPPPPRAVGPALGTAKPEEELPTQRKVPSILGTPSPTGAITGTQPTAAASSLEPAKAVVPRPNGAAPTSAEAPPTEPAAPPAATSSLTSAAASSGTAAKASSATAGTTSSVAGAASLANAAPSTTAPSNAAPSTTAPSTTAPSNAFPSSFAGSDTAASNAPPFQSSTEFDESAREVAPPSTTLESSVPSAPQAGPHEPAPRVMVPDDPAETLPGDRSVTLPIPRSVAIVLALALAGLLVLVTGALTFSSRAHRTGATAPEASAPASAETTANPAEAGCRLLAPAARLSIAAERSVQPVLAEVTRGERVAVGFASAPKTAAGAVIRLDTLDVARSPDQAGDAAVRSSVPLVKSGRVELAVDRAGGELTLARTLPDGTTLGFVGADLARRSGGKTTVLVAGAAGDKTTEPRVGVGGAGTLVTFRRGGLSGQVLYTWVGPDGSTNGSVTPVTAPGVKFSGTPDAAANANGGLLAFAGRASDGEEWRVHLVSVPRKGSAAVHTFVTPAGGSGGGNIAPAVTALGDDGWLLQWTEGAAGAYEVRLQRLNQKLDPVGAARLVSPKGANAGQGSLVATGSRVLSVFIQTTAGHDELWGATFECH